MAHHTDARLDEMVLTGGGYARAAGYLRTVADPEERDAIVAEAEIMTNLSPGWRWADAVNHHVREYTNLGRVSTRYRRLNAESIAKDNEARGR